MLMPDDDRLEIEWQSGYETGFQDGYEQVVQTLLKSLPMEQVAELLKKPLHEVRRILEDE